MRHSTISPRSGNLTADLEIKISDFGAAFWTNDPPKSTVTPLALRAPELIFEESFGSSIDIWSFGCLIYELLTGVQLFNVYPIGSDYKDQDDDDHLLDLNDVIEPLPDSWLSKWPRAYKYFGPNGERLVPEIDEDEEDMEEYFKFANDDDMESDGEYGRDEDYPDHMADGSVEDENAEEYDQIPVVNGGLADQPPMITNESLEVQFDKKKPDDIDSEEAKVITELIRKILRYEPSERPTAAELLQHRWFQD
ncbi:hypothetical protein PISL3812_03388 [Talaromyces islandicus]|uniref:Protein kinase domain-containing protein n=1 Tax=Talaromyces islandicus TaxID=28573 RepID=A0A0U1LTF2_TALIS|nr:hypothetical protein PISL3812_03388 [Talaromyces islandicus]